MGFPRQEYPSGLSFPSSGDLSDAGKEPGSPALQVDSLQTEPPGKSNIGLNIYQDPSPMAVNPWDHQLNKRITKIDII